MSVLARAPHRGCPHAALKPVEMGSSGSGEAFEAEAGREPGHLLPVPFPFFLVLPVFLTSFSNDTFWGQVPPCLRLCGCAWMRDVMFPQQGWRRSLARLSTAVFTQQNAVNMCLNEGRAKRFGCYLFPSETTALLKLKSFTV